MFDIVTQIRSYFLFFLLLFFLILVIRSIGFVEYEFGLASASESSVVYPGVQLLHID